MLLAEDRQSVFAASWTPQSQELREPPRSDPLTRPSGPQVLLPEPDAGPTSVRARLRVEVRDPATGLLEAVFEAGACDITWEGIFFREVRRVRTHLARHAPFRRMWKRGLRMFPEATAADAQGREPAERRSRGRF